MKLSIKITCDDRHITRRALEAVTFLTEHAGYSHDDIAKYTGCTVAMLLNPDTRLNRSHFTALSQHYGISRFWLWSGYGSMFVSSHLQSKIV